MLIIKSGTEALEGLEKRQKPCGPGRLHSEQECSERHPPELVVGQVFNLPLDDKAG